MSISAEPLNAPFSEIWITRESMVASTVPSTTSVSQSVISTPLSLMLGPTVSLLPELSLTEEACGFCPVRPPAGAPTAGAEPEASVFKPLAGVVWRWKGSGSRLPKKGFCTAIRSP